MARAPSLDRAPSADRSPSEAHDRTPPGFVGIVKFFSVARGYGFLRPASDADGDDVFFHHSELRDENLQAGDRVRFALIDSPRGPQAVSVEKLPVEMPSRP